MMKAKPHRDFRFRAGTIVDDKARALTLPLLALLALLSRAQEDLHEDVEPEAASAVKEGC
jgi:hypothetical protein